MIAEVGGHGYDNYLNSDMEDGKLSNCILNVRNGRERASATARRTMTSRGELESSAPPIRMQ